MRGKRKGMTGSATGCGNTFRAMRATQSSAPTSYHFLTGNYGENISKQWYFVRWLPIEEQRCVSAVERTLVWFYDPPNKDQLRQWSDSGSQKVLNTCKPFKVRSRTIIPKLHMSREGGSHSLQTSFHNIRSATSVVGRTDDCLGTILLLEREETFAHRWRPRFLVASPAVAAGQKQILRILTRQDCTGDFRFVTGGSRNHPSIRTKQTCFCGRELASASRRQN
jgi:hypothetical protein